MLGSEPKFTEHADRVEAAYNGWGGRADLLVVAIGIVANDYLASEAGLSCDDRVLTDENGATVDPNVFAIGDVSRRRPDFGRRGLRIESWQNANDQAVRAVRAMLGLENPAPPMPRFWSDQFGHTLHIAGQPNPKARAAAHPKLTLTATYNCLEKLRAGERIEGRDRETYEQRPIGILRYIHDRIDAAAAAYGWPVDLIKDQILHRLVALNRERAAEDASGLIRWLRPEYQNPGGHAAAIPAQTAMDVGVVESVAEAA